MSPLIAAHGVKRPMFMRGTSGESPGAPSGVQACNASPVRWFLLGALVSSLVACSGGHASRNAASPEPAGRRPAPSSAMPRIVVELYDGATPWTHLEARDSQDTFQFAIVTDRTGGMRPGVFESAVKKLNLLQPELVVSVGDLIDGYSEDRGLLTRQWEEFDALVADLEAPFFYVPGNHDITNATMREVWHQRYGPSRYAFVYKGVLFVCLDSMDGGLHQVSEEQVRWLESVLGSHANVNWTLLFLHSPLWDPDPDGFTNNWDRVEAVLGKRNYTAFAGHYHRYTKHVRNDRKHFTLATTGGGSLLRGPRYGEFDHVVWVTMSPSGPRIANLMLDGIRDEDVRTVPIAEFQKQVVERSLLPPPIFHQGTFESGSTEIQLKNPMDYPVDVRLELELPYGFAAGTQPLTGTVEPNSVLRWNIELHASKPISHPAISIPVRWRAQALIQGQDVVFEGSSQLGVVQLLRAVRATSKPKIDAQLGDWPELRFDVSRPAQLRKQAETWHGPADNRFSLDVRHDAEWLYVGVQVVDDAVRAEEKVEPWAQDGVQIRIDARPDPQRSHFSGAPGGQDVLLLALSPSQDPKDLWLRTEHGMRIPEGVEAACVRTSSGFAAEVAVPRAWAVEASGGKLERIRVNVAVDDGDEEGQSQSWWWSDWRSPEHIPGSGTFAVAD